MFRHLWRFLISSTSTFYNLANRLSGCFRHNLLQSWSLGRVHSFSSVSEAGAAPILTSWMFWLRCFLHPIRLQRPACRKTFLLLGGDMDVPLARSRGSSASASAQQAKAAHSQVFVSAPFLPTTIHFCLDLSDVAHSQLGSGF